MNLFFLRENKSDLKKMRNKFLDRQIRKTKIQLGKAPVTLKILAHFIPEEAPALNALGDFLKSAAGQKLTSWMFRGYDIAGDFLKGNYDKAKEGTKEFLKVFSLNDVGEIICAASKSLEEVLDNTKGVALA